MHEDFSADNRQARRERVVEKDKVGDLPGGDFAAVCDAERAKLVVARRLYRLVERPAGHAHEAAEPTGSDLIATVGFPCHSGATLSIRRLPSFVMARWAPRLIW